MPIRLIDTEQFISAVATIRNDRGNFADWVTFQHPKIAIAYEDWLNAEMARRNEEIRQNEIRHQEAIKLENARLEAEKCWAIRVVDVNNKVITSGKKIPIIKFLRDGCLGYRGLADAKQWSEGGLDVKTTEEKAKEFEIKFYNEFPMLKGLLNIWKFKN